MNENEQLLPLAAAVEQVSGQRPHASTFHRWRLRGIEGVRLETVRVGGRRLTSVEAVRRFVVATTAAADGEQPRARTPRQRQRAVEDAEKELAKDGI